MGKIVKKRHKSYSQNPYARIDWEKAKELFKQPFHQPAKKKNFPSTKEILHILAAAGTIGLTFAFPKIGTSIGRLLLGSSYYNDWSSDQVLKQLKKQKYVEIKTNDDGSITLKITQNGLVRALTYQLEEMTINQPKRWDKKWRVVIFDIPNKYKRTRDIFRMRLHQLGLYQLQESTYIHPYPCFDQIEFLRELYGITFTVNYLLVEKLEDDGFLRRRFELN